MLTFLSDSVSNRNRHFSFRMQNWFSCSSLFMGYCWVCRVTLKISHHGLCSYCLKNLPCLSDACPVCALPTGKINHICGRCLRQPPPWTHLIAAGIYQPPLSLLLGHLKFFSKTAVSITLARLMLLSWLKARRQYGIEKPDLLLSVPLHRLRAWRRGFNQADLLARTLAFWLNCDYRPELLKQSRSTCAQHSLNSKARQDNLCGAFDVEPRSIQGRHIALIDDVVTTGSTVTEVSKILLRAGAANIQVWCLCRTLSPRDDTRIISH